MDRSYGPEQLAKEFPGFAQVGKDGRVVQKTAMAESSGILGGYTVPPQFLAESTRVTSACRRSRSRPAGRGGRCAGLPDGISSFSDGA